MSPSVSGYIHCRVYPHVRVCQNLVGVLEKSEKSQQARERQLENGPGSASPGRQETEDVEQKEGHETLRI